MWGVKAMPYKVAVASSDGKVINEHFGRSQQFLIFEITDDDKWSFVELRENIPPCGQGEHNENDMQRTVNLLSDCKKVLVSRIGLGAEQALKLKGITAYTIPDFIDDALNKLVAFEKKHKNGCCRN